MEIFVKNRFFEAISVATAPLPFILHPDAVLTCTTSLQKMKVIGPVVIEISSVEIPAVRANPAKVQLTATHRRETQNRAKSRNRV